MIHFKENYGSIIKNYRKRKGLSVENLSKFTGVSISHIRKIENSNKNININNLELVMSTIDIDLTYIIEIKDEVSLKLLYNHIRFIRELCDSYEENINLLKISK